MSKYDEKISKYRVRKGFFDLSEKPKTLTKRDYCRILDLQMWLIHVEDNKKYYIENDVYSWRVAQLSSVKLRSLISCHWKIEELEDI